MTEETTERGLAASCMVETAEGPVAMTETPKKGFAVLTRLDAGGLGFRQLLKVEERDGVPCVRIALDNGHHVVLARGHRVFRAGMDPVRAGELRAGDALETAFRYPDGYLPRGAGEVPSAWGIHVTAVEPCGEGRVMFGSVRDTHRLFLTAGILCAE